MIEKLSASVASRHVQCHASANLSVAIPNWVAPVEDRTADNAANRGTLLHELFAELMQGSSKDAENFALALMYVMNVRKGRRFKLLSEHTVVIDWLTTRPATTADLVLYVADEIHIFDLKTGMIHVEVTDNAQMKYYALAYRDLAPKAKGVHLHIVQPWANNMEMWFADNATLDSFKAELLAAEAAIQSGSTTFGPGAACQFCPANPHSRGAKGKPLCPAMMKLLYPTVGEDLDEILKED